MQAKTCYKHIVVVHGIGDQDLNETPVNFMNELCRVLPDKSRYDLKVKNLVARDDDKLVTGRTTAAYVVLKVPPAGQENECDQYFIGFSEVYWQPTVNDYLKAHRDRLPVPIFTWAHSINLRLRGDKRNKPLKAWRDAIDNLETMLNLIRKLGAISKKSEDFAKITTRFLGDVEMYGETELIRGDINGVFTAALNDVTNVKGQIEQKIGLTFDTSDIYVVAHSEGTVVSWQCLKEAAAAQPQPGWLASIKGLVTMGSPIDKHHLFWPSSFGADMPSKQNQPIPWWNFWDKSDPVGYSLDGIFGGGTPGNNQFQRIFDSGYYRYPIPGLAHEGYWTDGAILRKITQEVMGIPAAFKKSEMAVGSLWWGRAWILRSVDLAAYCVLRVAEIGGMVYFLSKLLEPVGQTILDWLPLGGWMDLVTTQPVVPFLPAVWTKALHAAFWFLASSALWKLLWDAILEGPRDAAMNMETTDRIERYVQTVWMTLGVLFIALNVSPDTGGSNETKDYLGWAVGLAVVVLIWMVHTTIHKGLLQLWRYTQGGTLFRPASLQREKS